MVVGGEEELSAFATLSVGFLLDEGKVLADIEGGEEVDLLVSEEPAVVLRSVDDDLELQGLEACWVLPVEVALPVGDPPPHVVLSNNFIDDKRVLLLEVVRCECMRVLAWVLDVVHHDRLNEWKDFRAFYWLHQRIDPLYLLLKLCHRVPWLPEDGRSYCLDDPWMAEPEQSNADSLHDGDHICRSVHMIDEFIEVVWLRLAGDVSDQIENGVRYLTDCEEDQVAVEVLEVRLGLEVWIFRDSGSKLAHWVQADTQ